MPLAAASCPDRACSSLRAAPNHDDHPAAPLEGKQWLRPGVSYSRVLDAPFSRSSYQMVQIDIPFVF